MMKGFIAILLLLALGKPWCCCALEAKEKPASCCHGKSESGQDPQPDQPSEHSCVCKALAGLPSASDVLLKAPGFTLTALPPWSNPSLHRDPLPCPRLSLSDHAPPRSGPALHLLHCVLRC
ncbi:MAG: hypothetical protein DVB23_002820 [Verrucomicrobia bacterium]|nr:MAG: hypothetical protein DVB23_002820 [Verrucomicrobiota bacterium]